MKLKLLSDVKASHPAFRPRWRRTAGDVIAEEAQLGRLLHGVVCDDDGTPRYDLPFWQEPVGAVCVPVAPDGRIALLRQFRPVPDSAAAPGARPVDDPSSSGRSSWEVPRGFPNPGETPDQVARREAEEELGWTVTSVEYLGECNANTTYNRTSPAVFVVSVDCERGASAQPDAGERIDRVELFTWERVLRMVVEGEIFCGFTKAALLALHARRCVQER